MIFGLPFLVVGASGFRLYNKISNTEYIACICNIYIYIYTIDFGRLRAAPLGLLHSQLVLHHPCLQTQEALAHVGSEGV